MSDMIKIPDVIRRKDAIDAVRQAYEDDEMFDGYEYRLGELPSVQDEIAKAVAAVIEQPEIIMCKDCVWFRKEYGWNSTEYTVCGVYPTYHPMRREDDFCSRAERREE